MVCLLPLISSCSSSQIASYASNYATRSLLTQMGAPSELVSLGVNLQANTLPLNSLIKALIDEVRQHWGDDKTATPKEYVKYTNHYRTRVFIDFDAGKIHVETLDQKDLRSAIVTTLLTPEDPETVDIFSDQDIALGEEPMLYGQVLDHQKKPIRWQWRAERFADYLIKYHSQTQQTERGLVHSVHINLTDHYLTKRQYRYAPLVRQAAQRYQIKESLIYAIIRTESSFNPYAVSHASAYGLMQVIPHTAGRDVFSKVKNQSGEPDKNYLLIPRHNIDTGTAYLSLLETRYLKDIRDPLTRKYAVISAYNGGASSVLKTFDPQPSNAIKKINQLSSREVYQALTQDHPFRESRDYLAKVTRAERDFYKGKI